MMLTAGSERCGLPQIRHATLSHIPNDTLRSTGDTLHISASLPPGMSIVYMPNPGFVGMDTLGVLISDSVGGYQKAIIVLQEYNLPLTAGTLTIPSVICEGYFIGFSDSGSSPGIQTWTFTNGSAVVWPTMANTIVGEYPGGTDTLIYTVFNSCRTATAQAVVTVEVYPDSFGIVGADTLCVGSSYSFSGGIAGGHWYSSNATAVNTDSVFTCVFAGADTVFRALTNTCGSFRAFLPVTINPLPDAGLIFGADSVCRGATISLTPTAAGGSWSMTNGAAVVYAGEVTGIAAGLDTAVYTVTNVCGTAVAKQYITVLQLAFTGGVLGLDSVCESSQITVYDTVGSGIWSMSNNNAIINSTGEITGLIAGVDSVLYILTNYCGNDTAKKSILIKPQPYAGIIMGADTVCVNGTMIMTDTVSGGMWSATGTHISVTGDLVKGLSGGMDTVRYKVANSCGIDTARYPVFVQILPAAGVLFTVDTVLCVGVTQALTDSGATTTGTWFATNSNATVSGGVVTGVAQGMDTIFYIVSNLCGRDTASIPQIVSGLPSQPTLTGPTIVCVNRANDTLTGTPGGGTWQTTNGNATVSGGIVTAVNAGIDTVVYTVSNTCGDSSNATVITIPDAWTCDSISAAPNIASEAELVLYPNPTNSHLELEHCSGYSKIAIYNSLGQRLMDGINITTDHTTVDVTTLRPGIYFVKAEDKMGMMRVYKVVKG